VTIEVADARAVEATLRAQGVTICDPVEMFGSHPVGRFSIARGIRFGFVRRGEFEECSGISDRHAISDRDTLGNIERSLDCAPQSLRSARDDSIFGREWVISGIYSVFHAGW
jgi:hypothetical protein